MRYISWLQTTDLSIQKFSVRTSTSQLSMYSVWKNYMKSSLNTSILSVLKIVLVFDMFHDENINLICIHCSFKNNQGSVAQSESNNYFYNCIFNCYIRFNFSHTLHNVCEELFQFSLYTIESKQPLHNCPLPMWMQLLDIS